MLSFGHLHAEYFGSWKKLDISLADQGIVHISGFNGVGKSTIFTALYWALFGETPDESRADEIRGGSHPTVVTLTMECEGHDYTLTRYRAHPDFKNKVYFEGHGIPLVDEDSLVKTVQGLIEQFLGINKQVFLTTVYFSQRNFHKFHSMTDLGKKEFIESLTYASLFADCEHEVRTQFQKVDRRCLRLVGQIEGLLGAIDVLEERAQSIKDDDAHQQKVLEQWIKRLQPVHQDLRRCQDTHKSLLSNFYTVNREYDHASERLTRFERQLAILKKKPAVCPECGSFIDTKDQREKLINLRTKEEQTVLKLSTTRTRLDKQVKECEKNLTRLNQDYEKMRDLERELDVLQSKHQFSQEKLQKLTQEKQYLEQRRKKQERKKQYLKFWVQGFGFNGLRSYLLANALDYLNVQTKRYLHHVVGQRIDFSLDFQKNKLLTLCNGRSYYRLSGGERQILDLCTGLALRDLAEAYNKSRFNLLVADEATENLDGRLRTIAQDLLLQYAKPSTFLITHEGSEIRFSKSYRVHKIGKYSHLMVTQ